MAQIFGTFNQEGVSNVLFPTLCDTIDKCYQDGLVKQLFDPRTMTKDKQKFQNSVMVFLYKLFIQDHLQRHTKQLNDTNFQIKMKFECEKVLENSKLEDRDSNSG